jgi:UDP-glucose 4-epimerase
MVYGSHPPHPVSESDSPNPVSPYAAGKLAAETYLRLHAEEAGLSLSILRLATVYGPLETDPRAIPNFIRQVLAGKAPIIYGGGDDIRDYVHVDDVTEAMLLALVRNVNAIEVYNVGTGEGHTTRAIAAKIIRLTKAQVEPVYAPQAGIPNQIVCDVTRAANALGYQPRMDLDQGLVDEIQFFARNPRLWQA